MSKTTDSISSTCVLCCGGIQYFTVGPCNHHICLKCSTRMRVLCEQKYCSVCRAEMPKVIATAKLHPYDGIISHKFPTDHRAGIAFATPDIRDAFRRLLFKMCRLCPLRPPEKTFKELQDHMRKAHELFYCDLCIKHLKVFSWERKAYTRKELAVHRRKGDAKDTSYRGHPLCEFCDERYFDNDELLRHLRQQHYFCHFCEKDGVSNQYYNDYENLKEHFGEQHYLCEEDQCAQEQFTHVFRSSLDFKAHRATVHSGQMTRAQARQMRQLDVEINLPPRQVDRGGGGGAGFVRGRERRFHGNRDEGLATAIHASIETSRQEARQESGKQDREDREARRTKDTAPPKRQPPTSNKAMDGGSKGVASNPRTETEEDAGKGAVATGTGVREGTAEKGMRDKKKNGRKSPQSEGDQDEKKRSTESLEDVSGENKLNTSALPPKEMGKKKKNKGKTVRLVQTVTDNESVHSQSSKKLVHEKPSETEVSQSFCMKNSDYPAIGDEADLNVKCTKLEWTARGAKVEDFPSLGISSQPSIGTEVGSSFYLALQKRNTQPKPQMQPVAMPAQRSFANKDDDFPTLSSIAGMLGVDSAQSQRSQPLTRSNNSAWTSRDKPKIQPAETKPAKSKKKGKKSAKENQGALIRESNQKPPPGFEMGKKEAAPSLLQGNQSFAPKQPPPGLPPGLPPKVTTPAPAHPPSEPPLRPAGPAPPNPVSPPPGFGAGASVSNSHLPPGFNIYVHPSDFQDRNLVLAKQIKAYLGNQEAKFDSFRSISRKFRDGSTTAAEYYKECRTLLGDNLPKIFNELVSLLPDVVKQQELLSAQNDARIQEKHQKDNVSRSGKAEPESSKGRGRGSGVWKLKANASCSCPQCGQTLQRSELEGHLSMHQDFPSLATSAVSKCQPISAASSSTWPKIK